MHVLFFTEFFLINVLHVCKYYPPDVTGGIETSVKALIDGSASADLNYTILALSQTPRVEKLEHINVIRLALNFTAASCPVGFSLRKALKKYAVEADIIHYHYPWPYAEFLQNIRALKKPSLVTYHSDVIKQKWIKKMMSPFTNRFLNSMDKIIVSSKNYLESSETLKLYQQKCVLIPYGIADVATTYQDVPLSFQLPKKYILFLGVLRYYKGVDVLINAAKNSDIPIVIAGDGPQKESLMRLAADVKNIIFLGRVTDDEKYNLIRHCHAFVLPSIMRTEAFGVVLIDACQFGKAMITTELNTGTSFINQDQKTGLVVPPSDSLALRKAIETLYHDETLAAEYGLNARKRYEHTFKLEDYVKAYTGVYRELATGVYSNP